VVLQPVIQLGTAIHGKCFSGSALYGIQKPRHAHHPLLRPRKTLRSDDCFFPFGF
jgi:hypothetical protein